MSSSRIFEAANYGNLETVKMFIEEKGVSPAIVDIRDYSPETLVEVATKKGYLDMLKYLLGKDPRLINVQHGKYNYSRKPCNLLQLAIEPGHLEIVKYLVENHGADIYEVFYEAYTATNWAVYCDRLSIVKYFIEERNVDVNKPPVRENDQYFHNIRPLLCDAVISMSGYKYQIVHYLIKERKANLTVIDNGYEKILLRFLEKKDLEIIRYILFEEKNKMNIDWKENGYAFLESLVRYFHLKYTEDILRYLVREKCKGWNWSYEEKTLLHHAVTRLSFETVACLIENGADIDEEDGDGNTALHLALLESFRRGLDICKYLCEKGANVNQKNKKGETPLDMAVKKLSKVDSMLEACKLFIQHGANLNSVDAKGNKLMHIVVRRNLTNLLDYLVNDKHVDVNTLRETDNSTPLHCAAFWNNYEICKYLIEHGALVQQKNKNNTTPFDMAMHRILKKDDDGGKNNIMTRLCKLFLAHGTNVNWTDIEGNQLVHIAAMRNNIRLLDYLVRDKQVDINALRETDNWTPLHCAAFRGNFDICIYLIRQGANTLAEGKCGKTPAQVASDQELIDFIEDTSTTGRHRRTVKDYFSALLQKPTYQGYTQRRIAGEDNRNTTGFLDDDYIFGMHDIFFSYICLFSRYFLKNSIISSRPRRHTFVSTAAILQGRMDSIAENAINNFLNLTDS